jgi:hypothetical protein
MDTKPSGLASLSLSAAAPASLSSPNAIPTPSRRWVHSTPKAGETPDNAAEKQVVAAMVLESKLGANGHLNDDDDLASPLEFKSPTGSVLRIPPSPLAGDFLQKHTYYGTPVKADRSPSPRRFKSKAAAALPEPKALPEAAAFTARSELQSTSQLVGLPSPEGDAAGRPTGSASPPMPRSNAVPPPSVIARIPTPPAVEEPGIRGPPAPMPGVTRVNVLSTVLGSRKPPTPPSVVDASRLGPPAPWAGSSPNTSLPTSTAPESPPGLVTAPAAASASNTSPVVEASDVTPVKKAESSPPTSPETTAAPAPAVISPLSQYLFTGGGGLEGRRFKSFREPSSPVVEIPPGLPLRSISNPKLTDTTTVPVPASDALASESGACVVVGAEVDAPEESSAVLTAPSPPPAATHVPEAAETATTATMEPLITVRVMEHALAVPSKEAAAPVLAVETEKMPTITADENHAAIHVSTPTNVPSASVDIPKSSVSVDTSAPALVSPTGNDGADASTLDGRIVSAISAHRRRSLEDNTSHNTNGNTAGKRLTPKRRSTQSPSTSTPGPRSSSTNGNPYVTANGAVDQGNANAPAGNEGTVAASSPLPCSPLGGWVHAKTPSHDAQQQEQQQQQQEPNTTARAFFPEPAASLSSPPHEDMYTVAVPLPRFMLPTIASRARLVAVGRPLVEDAMDLQNPEGTGYFNETAEQALVPRFHSENDVLTRSYSKSAMQLAHNAVSSVGMSNLTKSMSKASLLMHGGSSSYQLNGLAAAKSPNSLQSSKSMITHKTKASAGEDFDNVPGIQTVDEEDDTSGHFEGEEGTGGERRVIGASERLYNPEDISRRRASVQVDKSRLHVAATSVYGRGLDNLVDYQRAAEERRLAMEARREEALMERARLEGEAKALLEDELHEWNLERVCDPFLPIPL